MPVALIAAAVACKQEVLPTEDPGEVQEPGEVPEVKDLSLVRINMSADTKAQFADQLGITWEEGDEIRFWGNTGTATATLAAGDITDGNKAAFDMAVPNVVNESPKGVFQYHWSTRNAAEWDFGDTENKPGCNATLGGGVLTVTQPEAGRMNKAFLFLQTTPGPDWGTVVPKAESTPTEISLEMQITGSIFRVLPYTEAYNDETVQSVSLSTNNNQTLGGTVAYNYAEGSYRDAQTINWLAYKQNVVNLATGFPLSGVTSRETSKGIYFALPRTSGDEHKLHGYNILVTTDKAKYTFSTTEEYAVQDNVVRNIFLKLENGTREDMTVVKGTYNFWGSIGEGQSFEYNADAHANQGLGYWVVSVLNTGETGRQTIEASQHPEYYVAEFSCIDDSTGAAADWLTVGYRPGDTWWVANIQANTGKTARSATVTATYPDNNNGYTVEEGFKTRTIHITQKGLVTIVPSITDLSATTIPADGGSVTATLNLTVDGVAATEDQYNAYVSEVTLTAENGSVSRNGHTLTISAGLNPKTEARVITVTAAAKDNVATVQVTQEASASAIAQTFTYGFSAWQAGVNQTFSRTINTPDEQTVNRNWVLVLTNVKDDNTNALPTNVEEFLKYGFQLTQEEYDAMAAFVKFEVEFTAGETKVYYNGVTANTGAARTFDKWWKTSDLSADYVHVTITQAAGTGASEPEVDENDKVERWASANISIGKTWYSPEGWAGGLVPEVALTAGNGYTATIPAGMGNAEWYGQNFIVTDIIPQASKKYDFSCKINATAGATITLKMASWLASDSKDVDPTFFYRNDVAVAAATETTFSVPGFSGADSAGKPIVLIIDLGRSPVGSTWTFSDISLKEY